MFTTTFAAVALGSVLSAGAVSVPTWQTDYSKAIAVAAAEQKPVAVFIGTGKAGYTKLLGGAIPAEAGKLLAKSFVCVYVNTDTSAGKSLAGKFEMSKGVVISGKGGAVQALRHTGNVPPTTLTTYLTKYSTAATISSTEAAGETTTVPTSIYSSCPNGRCPNAATIYSSCPNGNCPNTTYAPVYSGFSSNPFSSCPNGKCPNAR